MFNKSCRWLDLNPGLLVLEPPTLPNVPQPVPQDRETGFLVYKYLWQETEEGMKEGMNFQKPQKVTNINVDDKQIHILNIFGKKIVKNYLFCLVSVS